MMNFYKIWSYLSSLFAMVLLGIPNAYWTFKYSFVTRRRLLIDIEQEEEEKLENEVVVITGANRGLGKEILLEMARRKAIVVMGCRHLDNGKETADNISKTTGNTNLDLIHLDLLNMDSIENFARTVTERYGKVKVLVNNAAALKSPGEDLADGNNAVMTANHLGHFLLTNLLLESLKNAAPSRVVILSSTSLMFSRLNLDDFSMKRSGYGPMNIFPYANSKHCNSLFAMELSKRVSHLGIRTYSVCPGVIDTNLLKEYSGIYKHVIQRTKVFSASTAPDAAREFVIPLATWNKYLSETGKMYHFGVHFGRLNRQFSREEDLSSDLWNLSANLVHLKARINKMNPPLEIINALRLQNSDIHNKSSQV